MKKIIVWFLIIGSFLFFFSCKNSSTAQKSKQDFSAPPSILKKANDFVMSRTGAFVFNKYIKFDSLKSRKIKEGYFLRYNYVRPEYDFVNEPVYFTVDSAGKILKRYGIVGIPNCVFEPQNCVYSIDSAGAVEIARKNKLPAGLKKWDVNFRWNPELNKYVWHIITTVKEFGGAKSYKAEGEEILISPVDGTVLKKSKWIIR